MQFHSGTVDLYRFNDFFTDLPTCSHPRRRANRSVDDSRASVTVRLIDFEPSLFWVLCDQTVASSQSESLADQLGSTWAVCTCLWLRWYFREPANDWLSINTAELAQWVDNYMGKLIESSLTNRQNKTTLINYAQLLLLFSNWTFWYQLASNHLQSKLKLGSGNCWAEDVDLCPTLMWHLRLMSLLQLHSQPMIIGI